MTPEKKTSGLGIVDTRSGFEDCYTPIDKPVQTTHSTTKPASGPQLFVLNRAGWLSLREEPNLEARLTSPDAHAAIQRALAEEAE